MNSNLTDLISPASSSTVLIYDVHASESGALSILNDLYAQIKDYPDKTVKWIFAVSTPKYDSADNITAERFPWVKKSWVHRAYFDTVAARKLLKKHKPDQVFSLQNKGIDFYSGYQTVYMHHGVLLTDNVFEIKTDGVKLWLYQSFISKNFLKKLRKANKIVVQTRWMKDALIKKAGIESERIVIQHPNISNNKIGNYTDCPENRRRFFYPASAFTYKNHMTLLKAFKYAQDRGLSDYELILTIRADENGYTKGLAEYAEKNSLNVLFGGSISRDSVFELYSKSVLVFPSYLESFGMPLLEARMSGCPIIASDTPFAREILDGYDKARFFRETDHEELGNLVFEEK